MNLNARITALRKSPKPYRAKLNDQIAKIVIFSWFGMKSVYFRMIKTLIWKLAKLIIEKQINTVVPKSSNLNAKKIHLTDKLANLAGKS